MKGMKKWFAGLLAVVVVVTAVPVGQVNASEETTSNVQSEVASKVQSDTSVAAIERVVWDDITLLEGVDGSYTNRGLTPDPAPGEWFCYEFIPTCTVYLTDGTTIRCEDGTLEYNGETYGAGSSAYQSYYTQWGPGTYPLTAEFRFLENTEGTFTATVVAENESESLIESIEAEDVTIIESTNGYANGDTFTYYYNPQITVRFKDGTTTTSMGGGIWYKNQYYQITYQDTQSFSPWYAGYMGDYCVIATVMGKSTMFEVDIIENPVESIVAEDMSIPEYTNGSYMQMYNPETGKMDLECFSYSISPKLTVTYKDGHVEKDVSKIEIGGISYLPIFSGQAPGAYWGVGEHEVTGTFLGKEFSYIVEITECPYESLEITKVLPVMENKNFRTNEDGDIIYDIPQFTYKVNCKDGSVVTGIYGDFDNVRGQMDVRIVDTQNENPWTVGGDNSFTVKFANLEAEVKVDLRGTSEFEWVEQNGELYITECTVAGDTIEIPETINNKKVVGIISLGDVKKTVKHLVIPDSVRSIGSEIFSFEWYVEIQNTLETISIGSGVNYLDLEMFSNCYNLRNITVSPDNPYYCDVDGVLYDKAKETLIVYPMAKGNSYEVPVTVKNIDILNADLYSSLSVTFAEGSAAYVTENGVVYNADKTKVIFCNSEATGVYEMPDTVTEIADGAFKNSQFTEVRLSDNVTEITYEAFLCCNSLTKVELPKNLKKIDNYAFNGCEGIKEIEFPATLESIGDFAFTATSLTRIEIPNSVVEIGDRAFHSVPASVLSLGQNVKVVGECAFANIGIKELVIPDSVTSIGESAFNRCLQLEKVVVGKGINYLEGTFDSCTRLQKVEFVNENVLIGGEYTFYGCPLEDVNFENVKNITGRSPFEGSNFKEVKLAEGVTDIAYAAFANSTELSVIDVPESVERVGGDAFGNTAWYNAQTDGAVYLEHIFYKHKGSMPNDTEYVIKEGTTVIADYALMYSPNMEEVTLPKGFKAIGIGAFAGSEKLKSITIPDTVSYIGRGAFANCGALTEILVDDGNKYYSSVDGVLFNKDQTELIWCPKQSSDTYTVPSSVKVIKEGAFGESDLKNIIISEADVVLEYTSVGYKMEFPSSVGGDEYTYKPLTIHCLEGAKAQVYAENNLLDVVLIEPENPITGVVLDKTSADMKVGGNLILTAQITPEDTTDAKTLTWTSSNPAVATVENGIVKAVESGTATITVTTSNGKSASCIVEITEDIQLKPITTVVLDKASADMKVGGNLTLTAQITPDDTTDAKTLTWTSSNPAVATVENGIVKAVGIGTTTITVTTCNGKSAICVVRTTGDAQWIHDGKGWWYRNEDGSYPKNGWHAIEGGWYYFDASGYRTENQWVDDYYVKDDGIMATNQWIGAYYVGADGAYVSQSGWLQVGANWYYLGADGARQTDWQSIHGTWYYFDANGVMATGWQAVGGTWYYFAGSGEMTTGWQAIGGTWYYFAGSGEMTTGWQAIGGTWYYFAGSGEMTTGWQAIGGTWYYFAGSGEMKTGWQAVDGTWYYFAGSGEMTTGWQAIGGVWYYFAGSGEMTTGWQQNGGTWYYFAGSGEMKTGWQAIGGVWYYFAESGAMAANQWVGNYYLYGSGEMATNTWVGNYYVGADGAWVPGA